jgi:ribonuclease HII
MASKAPNLRLEKSWIAGGMVVGGSDEVGRGCLGGPVSAGVVVIDASTRRPPAGLRDSKLLTPAAREKLVPRIERWAVAWGVGHASAGEIDRFGILAALRLAGERALVALPAQPDLVLLDGSYDWYSRPMRCDHSPLAAAPERVVLKVKADVTCASVSAASVLAKVARDALMVEMSAQHPGYGWDINKGYATPEHRAALREIGPCAEHRRSWRLGCDDGDQLELDLDELAAQEDAPGLAAAGE